MKTKRRTALILDEVRSAELDRLWRVWAWNRGWEAFVEKAREAGFTTAQIQSKR